MDNAATSFPKPEGVYQALDAFARQSLAKDFRRIDPKTARVVGTYSSRNWMNRWLYHGLHSLDFPWLYNHRPLWDVVVITFMAGGTALCVTSLVLAWRVLGRTLRRATVADTFGEMASTDDLPVER